MIAPIAGAILALDDDEEIANPDECPRKLEAARREVLIVRGILFLLALVVLAYLMKGREQK